MVERSPGDWTEENVGEKLLVLLHYLKKHLTKQKMPNYFLSKRNMFATIGNSKLKLAQERCFRLIELLNDWFIYYLFIYLLMMNYG